MPPDIRVAVYSRFVRAMDLADWDFESGKPATMGTWASVGSAEAALYTVHIYQGHGVL